uniref:Uncharacterized protein n=1 Tax=Arundo donax TaxID=35708 RepID=A0A0A9A3B9_ARUDO
MLCSVLSFCTLTRRKAAGVSPSMGL